MKKGIYIQYIVLLEAVVNGTVELFYIIPTGVLFYVILFYFILPTLNLDGMDNILEKPSL